MVADNADVSDDNDHGTHDAGIVAARRDNGIGGSGIAPDATIMPVKVLNAAMAGDNDKLARGIRYAVDEGARILSVSINGDTDTNDLDSAVRYAGEHGAIIVAAAGNNARDIDLTQSFPASLQDPAILTVAADTATGGLWSGSNTGLRSVDLSAPGELILSTARGSAYQTRTGTSAATPFVAGALALLSSARPDLPTSVLRDALLSTARRSSGLASLLSSGGRLDVATALHRVLGASWRAGAPAVTAAPALRVRTTSKGRAGARSTVRWRAAHAGSVARWRVSLDGRVVATLPAGATAFSRRIARRGRHGWRVVGFDSSATKVVAARRAFRLV